jgi:hypothetical protein
LPAASFCWRELKECGADGEGGYGGGFGAEDAGTEGYRLPLVLGEEGDLFGGPAAFGAYGYGVGDGRSLSDGLIICRLN